MTVGLDCMGHWSLSGGGEEVVEVGFLAFPVAVAVWLSNTQSPRHASVVAASY